MSVKGPLGFVLYCYLNMPTINKTYLILSYIRSSFELLSRTKCSLTCVVLLCIFKICVCCNVHYDLRLYLELTVVCRRAHALFGYLCLFAYRGVQHLSCCILFRLSSSCVPYVSSFSGLEIFYCPLGFL